LRSYCDRALWDHPKGASQARHHCSNAARSQDTTQVRHGKVRAGSVRLAEQGVHADRMVAHILPRAPLAERMLAEPNKVRGVVRVKSAKLVS
jgi:hypothetical protein